LRLSRPPAPQQAGGRGLSRHRQRKGPVWAFPHPPPARVRQLCTSSTAGSLYQPTRKRSRGSQRCGSNRGCCCARSQASVHLLAPGAIFSSSRHGKGLIYVTSLVFPLKIVSASALDARHLSSGHSNSSAKSKSSALYGILWLDEDIEAQLGEYSLVQVCLNHVRVSTLRLNHDGCPPSVLSFSSKRDGFFASFTASLVRAILTSFPAFSNWSLVISTEPRRPARRGDKAAVQGKHVPPAPACPSRQTHAQRAVGGAAAAAGRVGERTKGG